MRLSAAVLFCLLAPAVTQAELSVPHFFSDHMVLQRDREVAIWGQSEPGAKVTVSFRGKSVSAKTDTDGRWKTAIPSGAANAKGAPYGRVGAGDNHDQ